MISTPPCKTMLSLTTLLCRRVILSFYHIFSIDIVYRCRSLVKALSDIVSGSIPAMTYEQFFLFHWVFLINGLISACVHPEYEFGLHTTISRCKWSHMCLNVWYVTFKKRYSLSTPRLINKDLCTKKQANAW